MPILAQSSDGVIHQFPDGTDSSVVDRVMKSYAGTAPQMSGLESFGTGALNDVVNLGQTAAHAIAAPVSLVAPSYAQERLQKLDTAVEARKKRVQEANPQKGYETAGEIATTIPMALVDAPVTMGMVAGATSAAKPGADFWADKFKDMALGGALGKAGDLTGKAIGKVIAPKVSPDVAQLMNEGITLTPGQMGGKGVVGRTIKRGEEALESYPVVGSLIRHGRENAVQRFNRVAINRALAPIEEKLGTTTAVGHPAIEEMANKINQAYEKVAPSITYKPSYSPEYQRDMAEIHQLVTELHPDQAKQFNAIIKNRIYDRLKNGVMSGKDFIRANSDLGKMAREKLRSTDGNQQQLGHVLSQVQEALFNDLERVNPKASAELAKAHQAYGASQTIMRAAANRAGSDAIFTPKDLLVGQRAGMTKGAIAKGRGAMTDFAERAHRVMGDSVRNSGTPERQQFIRMLDSLTSGLKGEAAGAGALVGAHALGIPSLALIPPALAALPYTKPGMAVLRAMLSEPGPKRLLVQKIIEQASRRAAPVISKSAPALYNDFVQ